ncbi:hypothetical protein STFR1_50358 [Bacillus vallismortis]
MLFFKSDNNIVQVFTFLSPRRQEVLELIIRDILYELWLIYGGQKTPYTSPLLQLSLCSNDLKFVPSP